jgi:cyanoexosortase A
LFFLTTVSLALWHGILTSRIDSDELTTTFFFWLVALFIIWKKRTRLVLDSTPWTNVLGIVLLGTVIYRGLVLFWHESFVVQFLPFFSFLGLVLMTTRWRRIHEYTRPLLVFFIFTLSDYLIGILNSLFRYQLNFSQITANVTAFFLHNLGFNVAQQGIIIFLPKGSVSVGYPCTGGNLIAFLVPLSLVLFVAMPLNWQSRLKLLLGLTGFGFFLGVIRVALLALVVSDQSTFKYWHEEEGNQIFSVAAFALWIVLANWVYESYESQLKQKPVELHEEELSEDTEGHPRGQSSSAKGLQGWLLPGVSILVALITVLTLLFPQIGRRQLPNLNYPSQISLAGWNQANRVSLMGENENTELSFEYFRSGQKYQYYQGEKEVTVQLKLIEGTLGHVPGYVKTYTSLKKAFSEGRTQSQPGMGRYQLFSDESQAYLSACLTSNGESTVTGKNFVSKMNRNLLRENLLPKIVGQKSLRQRRCLWVHLSTPVDQDSPEEGYRVLESVFEKGYSQWQGLF